MPVIQSSRRRLDRALLDPRNVLLLLFAERGSAAEDVYDLAEDSIDDPSRHTFLITNPDLLSDEELQDWDELVLPPVEDDEIDPGTYTIVSANTGAVVVKDDVVNLLRSNGDPSILAIRRAFAKGDQA